jgi:hypothetical protein
MNDPRHFSHLSNCRQIDSSLRAMVFDRIVKSWGSRALSGTGKSVSYRRNRVERYAHMPRGWDNSAVGITGARIRESSRSMCQKWARIRSAELYIWTFVTGSLAKLLADVSRS